MQQLSAVFSVHDEKSLSKYAFEIEEHKFPNRLFKVRSTFVY